MEIFDFTGEHGDVRHTTDGILSHRDRFPIMLESHCRLVSHIRAMAFALGIGIDDPSNVNWAEHLLHRHIE